MSKTPGKISEYLSSMIDNKIDATDGNGQYIWIKFERLAAIRFPEFNTGQPSKEEIKNVFKSLKCLVISYTIIPENSCLINSTLYNCTDNNYNYEKLNKNVRRDIRIAQRNLRFCFTEWNEILAKGSKAFVETRSRVGLSDGNEKEFRKRFNEFSKNPYHKAASAWIDNEIIAFMSLVVVDDYVIIQGSFSTDEHRKYCPNNGLIDFVLNYFLVENNFSNVCYGLSSIQENTSKEGLHNYKVRVGFDAIAVQRVFILHPWLSPLTIVLRIILYMLLSVFPTNRTIKKAVGLLKNIYGKN